MGKEPYAQTPGTGTIPTPDHSWGAGTSQLHTKYISCVISFTNMPFCEDSGAQKFGFAEHGGIHL